MFERINPDRPYRAPSRQYQGDAGYDLHAPTAFTLMPGEINAVVFNCRIRLPHGWFAMLQERSSQGRQGIVCHGNVIDEGYTGEFGVLLQNLGKIPVHYNLGDRIAQIVPMKRWIDPHEDLLPRRNGNGFGSTGK